MYLESHSGNYISLEKKKNFQQDFDKSLFVQKTGYFVCELFKIL